MSNWLESHGYLTGWIGLLLTLRRDVRRLVRRTVPGAKRAAAIVAGYLTVKVVGYYLRFFAPKEVVQEAAKLMFLIGLAILAAKMLEDMPKTSEQAAA